MRKSRPFLSVVVVFIAATLWEAPPLVSQQPTAQQKQNPPTKMSRTRK